MMQLVQRFMVLPLLIALMAAPSLAYGYGRSEDEEMKEEITEAVRRARDFSAQKVREATEDLERERGAQEVKKQRAAFEAEREKERESFVVERNSKPSEAFYQARLERQFDQEKAVEDRQMDKARAEYREKRNQVNAIIKKKAHINENEEYGL